MKKYEKMILQNAQELDEYLALLQRENVRSYLEIGSKYGGCLWRVANALPKGSRIVSIDLPFGDGSFKVADPHLTECVADLKARGYDAHLRFGDSTAPEAIAFAAALGPFDCVMIDADHSEPYIRQDWANYGPLGQMVAFHDINWKPRPEPSKKKPIEVPKVWGELKRSHRHVEIVHDKRDNGIGVLWR